MNEFKKINLSKVAKAAAVGGVGLLVATIAPLGAVAVGTITVATAAVSWAADSISDSFKNNKK